MKFWNWRLVTFHSQRRLSITSSSNALCAGEMVPTTAVWEFLSSGNLQERYPRFHRFLGGSTLIGTTISMPLQTNIFIIYYSHIMSYSYIFIYTSYTHIHILYMYIASGTFVNHAISPHTSPNGVPQATPRP